jgi:uncharacterized low-complexity protein
MNANKTTLALALTLGAVGMAHAATPFAMQPLSQGYMVAAADKAMDGKCGEGKCGGSKAAKVQDGKCGSDAAKMADGKCGADKSMAKAKDGKCGEGKCGSKK